MNIQGWGEGLRRVGITFKPFKFPLQISNKARDKLLRFFRQGDKKCERFRNSYLWRDLLRNW